MADFDSTKGGAAANSYADVDFADDLLELDFGSDEWFSQSDPIKEKLLATASKMIDRLNVAYDPAATTQALKFPLGAVAVSKVGDDGFAAAKKATVYQALYLLMNNDALQEAQNSGIMGATQESLSSISRTVTGFNVFKKHHPEALRLLMPYLNYDFRVYRG